MFTFSPNVFSLGQDVFNFGLDVFSSGPDVFTVSPGLVVLEGENQLEFSDRRGSWGGRGDAR